MKKRKIKKDSFIKGAFIATFGIIIVKIIGLLYVIPFNAIIGEQGGALYGYAYNIYSLFLAISSAGFPFAISKLTSEYDALGNKNAVDHTYKIAIRLILGISVVFFILLFIFAPQIGKLILGNIADSSSYSDIAFVIRCVSPSILVIPFLSVTRGFLQGNKYISPISASQIIEQIVRVIIIIVGSFLALNVFKTDLKTAVGIAVSGSFFGGLLSYIYLKYKIKSNKLLNNKELSKDANYAKEIIRKILMYSVPFIIISLINNLYTTVDMILISRSLRDILRFPSSIVDSTVSIFTTWGAKLNNIILALVTGLTTSLIPNIVSSYTKNDKKDVDNKFNKAIQYVLLFVVPCALFFSFLSGPIWYLFYGESEYGPIIYKLYVFGALFGGIYSIILNTLQGLSKYKLIIITVLVGFVLNATLDVPLILLMNKIGFEPSYGAILAAFVGYFVSIIMCLIVLHKKYNFSFLETRKKLPSLVFSWIIFELTIIILKIFIPINLEGRLVQIPILSIYGIVCFGIYFVINYINGNLKDLLKLRKRGVKK